MREVRYIDSSRLSNQQVVVRIGLQRNGNIEPRTLKLDGPAIRYLKKATGKDMLKREFVPASITDIDRVLYAATMSSQKTEGKLTFEEFLDGMFSQQFREALDICMRLMGNLVQNASTLAPFVKTPASVLRIAMEMSNVKGKRFIDLGCGNGPAVFMAAKAGAAEAVGIELNENRAKVAELLVKPLENARIELGSILDFDFSGYDCIFTYLLQDSMEKLRPLFEKLKPGSVIVSHDFQIVGWDASEYREVFADDRKESHKLTKYVIGEHIPKTVDLGMPLSDEDAEELAAVLAKSLTDDAALIEEVDAKLEAVAAEPEVVH